MAPFCADGCCSAVLPVSHQQVANTNCCDSRCCNLKRFLAATRSNSLPEVRKRSSNFTPLRVRNSDVLEAQIAGSAKMEVKPCRKFKAHQVCQPVSLIWRDQVNLGESLSVLVNEISTHEGPTLPGIGSLTASISHLTQVLCRPFSADSDQRSKDPRRRTLSLEFTLLVTVLLRGLMVAYCGVRLLDTCQFLSS